jgi:hypothetical protein
VTTALPAATAFDDGGNYNALIPGWSDPATMMMMVGITTVMMMMMMVGITTHLSPAGATQPIQETYRIDSAAAAKLPYSCLPRADGLTHTASAWQGLDGSVHAYHRSNNGTLLLKDTHGKNKLTSVAGRAQIVQGQPLVLTEHGCKPAPTSHTDTAGPHKDICIVGHRGHGRLSRPTQQPTRH